MISHAMYFAIRAGVMSTIVVAFYLTRGFGSITDTFVIGLFAASTGHAVVIGLRMLRATDGTPRDVVAALGVTVILAGASLVFVLVHAPHHGRGALPYRTVDELLADPVADEIKLHGYVELGTLTARVDHQQMTHHFMLAQNKQRIAVDYVGPAPDTLKDRAEVVVTGRASRLPDGTYTFAATELMAKCPSTYQTPNGPVPAAKYR